MKPIFIFLFSFVFSFAYSFDTDNGSVKGKVLDSKTGELLPGVVVFVEGTSIGTSTDMDGNFMLKNIPVGSHNITFKFIGYTSKSITDVKIKKGEITSFDITLESSQNELTEVVVTATVNKESNTALLLQQKNSAVVSDGISSEAIKRTPDKSTSDVLKRVSGASIQENKFAVIRGLNDRYNAAYINGAPLPSSESDRKAFAFDIFPANMLDNLVIIKTATPDLPAEFAGGIIQINTKSIPEENFQSVSIGSAYNTITTGKDQLYYKGGKTDWLGIDDGTRAMPDVIPDKENFPIKIDDQAALAKQTNVDWALYNKKFSPNYSFQYSFGRNIPIKNQILGITAAITYNRTNNYNETLRRAYTSNSNDNSNIPSQIDYDYLDKTYSEQTLAGALANVSYKINDNNSIAFKNLYSINSDDRVIERTGETNPLESNPTLLKSTARWFTSNKVYSGQLNGDHYLPKTKIRINWLGGLSKIEREIPNLRRSVYTRLQSLNDPSDPNPYDTVYTASVSMSSVGQGYGGGMFWSKNEETIYSGKIDVSYNFPIGKQIKNEIKIGGFAQTRSRDFSARQLGYTQYGKVGGNVTFNNSLLHLDENEIFSSANMGLISPPTITSNGVGGFKIVDGTRYSDAYAASSNLQATYLMFDNRYKSFLRLIWGARAENFSQKLDAVKSDKSKLNLATTKLDVLPSANLILSVTEKQNVRFSYSQTLNRPEYRELAPFAFYDFNTQFVLSGYDSLQRAKIHNADVRYEFYPGRGQLVSVSGFYKKFQNPIEQISRPDVISEISFRNVPTATNYGTEIEFRVLLGSLLKKDSCRFLNNLTAFTNLAIIRSQVDVADVIGAEKSSRPLQGQSPYVLNGGIQYLDNELGYSISASLNRVGTRIFIVGNVNEPTIWENGRTFLDLQLTKSFWKKKIELKFNAQNVLAQEQIFYQNRNTDNTEKKGVKGFFNSIATGDKQNKNGYNENTDDKIWATKFGRVFSLNLSIRF